MALTRISDATRKAATQPMGEVQAIFDEFEAALSPRIVKVDVPNSTNVMAALNDLKCDLGNGKNYHFDVVLRVADSNMEGLSIDFNGGSATVSYFWASALGWALEPSMARHSAALATALSYESLDGGDGLIMIRCFVTVNVGGTFIPRFAQVAHSTGSITVKKGSWISPPLEVIT
jgi:hypothetical protein